MSEQWWRRGAAVVTAVALALVAQVPAPSAAFAANPVWKITVVVDVPNSVAAKYEGTAPMLSRVVSQIGDVSTGMNTDGKRKGTISLSVSKVNFFNGVPEDVLSKSAPRRHDAARLRGEPE